MKTAFVLSACGAILVVSWCCVSLRSERVAETSPVAARAPRSTPEVLEALERQSRRAAQTQAASDTLPTVVAAMADDELLARLRATSRAFLEHDEPGLTENLEALLAAPGTPRRVLELMVTGRISAQAAEGVGATVAIGFAVARAARGSGDHGAHVTEGRPFVREFLEALARMERESGEPAAEFTASLVVDGRPAVGARWIGTIADLRARSREHAENFDALLNAILANLDDAAVRGLDTADLALIVSSSSDALAVQAALAVLVQGDPANYVSIAEDLHASSPRSGELGSAIVSAIAQHAPVETAAASLARLADADLYGQFARFGARTGALAAAEKEYSALLAAGQNPLARKMLVSSMGQESEQVLVGIAEMDTDAAVRGQALLTLTQRPVESPAVMRTVRDQHAARGSAASGMSTSTSLMVAENVAIHGTPAVRSEAIAWLRQVATDPNESLEDRRNAWTKLRVRAEPSELEGLTPPR